MGFRRYFSRRVVRAELKPSEGVTAVTTGFVRFEDYLSEGPGERAFTRVVGMVVTALALVNVVIGLVAPWLSPDGDAPEWSLWLITLPWSVALGWLSALQIAGLRAMYRHREDPSGKT